MTTRPRIALAVGGPLGIALVFPRDATSVRVLVTSQDSPKPVIFTDDGSLAMDAPGDGEHWALIAAKGATADLQISGDADGLPVAATLAVAVPTLAEGQVYPVTLIAQREGLGWTLERAYGSSTVSPTDPGRADVADGLARAGVSPVLTYVVWGLVALVVIGGAVVRGAVLNARASSR